MQVRCGLASHALERRNSKAYTITEVSDHEAFHAEFMGRMASEIQAQGEMNVGLPVVLVSRPDSNINQHIDLPSLASLHLVLAQISS